MNADDERHHEVFVDWTEELKWVAFEWSMKNEKGEDLFKFDKNEENSKPKTLKVLAETWASKVSAEVEKEF